MCEICFIFLFVQVGIRGEEGVQAVNASDYAIAQFRFLGVLLLKHGRYNYLRMSNLICYMFYKNICMSLTMFWFNFLCAFSGEKMYTEGAIQFFNLFYTSIPILLYGTYDKDVAVEDTQRYPQLYRDGIRNAYFNVRILYSYFWLMIRLKIVLIYCNCTCYILDEDILGMDSGCCGRIYFGLCAKFLLPHSNGPSSRGASNIPPSRSALLYCLDHHH